VVDYTFDTDVQGFVLNDYPDTSSLNLAGKYAVDGGTGDAALPDLGTLPDGGAAIANPTLAFDATVDSAGLATSGSLKVTVTFTAPKQYVDVALNFSPPRDLSNRILRARLRQTSGNFSGGAQLHISTGPTYGGYGKADFSGIAPGAWAVASLDSSVAVSATAEALDLAMTQQVGIQIYSGTATTDAGTYANAGEQVVFNIDTIVSN
jgi:hypothetical protein